MRLQHLLSAAALLVFAAGCGCRPESPPVAVEKGQSLDPATSADKAASAKGQKTPAKEPASREAEPADECDKEFSKRPGYQVYRTRDTKKWPRYSVVAEIKLACPEVPQSISQPSPPIHEGSSATDQPSVAPK